MRTWRWDVLARLCRKHGLVRGAEIGVADGRFTRGLLSAIPELALWAIDDYAPGYSSWDGAAWSQEQQDANKTAFAEVLAEFQRRLTFLRKPSLEAAAGFADAALDFVFIDADHSYEAVAADIAAWAPKVRPGGFVTGHDFDSSHFPGVIKAVTEAFPKIKTQEDYVWMAQIQ